MLLNLLLFYWICINYGLNKTEWFQHWLLIQSSQVRSYSNFMCWSLLSSNLRSKVNTSIFQNFFTCVWFAQNWTIFCLNLYVYTTVCVPGYVKNEHLTTCANNKIGLRSFWESFVSQDRYKFVTSQNLLFCKTNFKCWKWKKTSNPVI
jgi:hypothetical protein